MKTIFRSNPKQDFTSIPHSVSLDSSLSFTARGLYATIASGVKIKEIQHMEGFKEGFAELIRHGLVNITFS